MEWLSEVTVAVASSAITAMGHRLMSPKLDRTTRSLVGRFRELLQAHEIPLHQASRLIGEAIPAADVASSVAIAKVLTPDRLDAWCNQLAVNEEWLIHGVGIRQTPLSIEPHSRCWIDELGEAKRSHDVSMVICRSEAIELEDQPRQAGAIIFRRDIGRCGDVPIHACMPYMSLQSWNVPEQRNLATRLIVACNALKIRMVGVTIPAIDCHRIAAGEQFAATYAATCRSMVWHPEDYGHTSRSASAKSTDWHEDAVQLMEAAGQIDRLVIWQEQLGIRGEWVADAMMRSAVVSTPLVTTTTAP